MSNHPAELPTFSWIPYLLRLGLKDFDPPFTTPLFELSLLLVIPFDSLHCSLLDRLGPEVEILTGASEASRRVSVTLAHANPRDWHRSFGL